MQAFGWCFGTRFWIAQEFKNPSNTPLPQIGIPHINLDFIINTPYETIAAYTPSRVRRGPTCVALGLQEVWWIISSWMDGKLRGNVKKRLDDAGMIFVADVDGLACIFNVNTSAFLDLAMSWIYSLKILRSPSEIGTDWAVAAWQID